MVVKRSAGTATHRLIAAALSAEHEPSQGTPAPDDRMPMPVNVIELSRQMWKLAPVGGAVAGEVRRTATTLASKYLRNWIPEGWTLLGCEVRLEGAVADVVWEHPETDTVLIQEIKTGRGGMDDPAIVAQIKRLAAAGETAWRHNFGGVQLVTLAAHNKAGIWRMGPHGLVPVDQVLL